MKKNYIIPSVRSIIIETVAIVAGSITQNEGTAVVNIDSGSDPVNDTEFDSRTNSLWDSEW